MENGKLKINQKELTNDLTIYVWEKNNVISNRVILENDDDSHLCIDKSLTNPNQHRGVVRSYAGVRWMPKSEHQKLPHLVQSILGRAVWVSRKLYYILTTNYGTWTENEKN